MKAGTCPCCGADVDPERVLVDLDSNVLTYNGKSIDLTPKAAEIAYVLAKEFPKAISRDLLIRKVYGRAQNFCVDKEIVNRVNHLQRKLESVGLSITPSSVGYKLKSA